MFSNAQRFLSRPLAWVSLGLAGWLVTSAMACGSSDDPGGGSTIPYGGSSSGAAGSAGSGGAAGVAGVAGGPAGGVGGVISVDSGGGGGDSGGARPCSPPTNLCLRRVTCPNGGTTTISGKVYIPNGTLPLYNATVYIPNGQVTPIAHGANCDRCDARLSGEPIASALTDTTGAFKLENVPVGENIPLVIQIGKWRRQVTIPNVTECTDNALTDANLTRLPRDKSEGDMPLIALTTGDADALECLLRKIGIADSEFTTEAGMGSVNFYAGMESGHEGTDAFNATLGGQTFTDAETFWDTQANMMKYDVVLLSCEGSEDPNNKSQAARQNMKAYLDAGGRVFASHWHNYWVEFGPAPFPTAANFDHRDDPQPGDATIDTSFPKGQALADWLFEVKGSTTKGSIRIQVPQATVRTVNTAQRWIYNDSWQAVQYMTQNTPMEVPEEQQCGRLVLSDIHVSSGSGRDVSNPENPFPNGCRTTDLSPEEKALIFMLFDLSACVTTDKKPPPPPA
jgi:hypothetical protein